MEERGMGKTKLWISACDAFADKANAIKYFAGIRLSPHNFIVVMS